MWESGARRLGLLTGVGGNIVFTGGVSISTKAGGAGNSCCLAGVSFPAGAIVDGAMDPNFELVTRALWGGRRKLESGVVDDPLPSWDRLGPDLAWKVKYG